MGVATPTKHKYEAFTWQHDLIKAFKFEEINKREFIDKEAIIAINDRYKLYCYQDIHIIGKLTDLVTLKQTRIDLILQINEKLKDKTKVSVACNDCFDDCSRFFSFFTYFLL